MERNAYNRHLSAQQLANNLAAAKRWEEDHLLQPVRQHARVYSDHQLARRRESLARVERKLQRLERLAAANAAKAAQLPSW